MSNNETSLVPAVFDQLQNAMATDRVGFTDLYRDYLEDAWRTLEELREAVRQQRLPEVRDKAHYLKSSSLVLGAHEVALCVTRLEERARVAGVIEEIEVERTADALSELQNELAQRLGSGVLPTGKTAAGR